MTPTYPCLLLMLMISLPGLGNEPLSPSEEEKTAASKVVAFTFDDLPSAGAAMSLSRALAMTQKQLEVLDRHKVPAVGFVNESKLFGVRGEVDERIALLDAWLDKGHLLGNHTFSHPSLVTTPLAIYKEDVLRGETVTRILLQRRGQELVYFRHPFLRTGGDTETREQFESWLAKRNYTIAPVTLENSDYVFAAIYAHAKVENDHALMAKTIDAYLAFTGEMITYLEGASQHLFQRQIPHVMLLHVNELNADCGDRLIELFKARGYGFVTMSEAMKDPAYQSEDRYAGRAGVNWLFRWDHARGRTYNWRAEPLPPQWAREWSP